jgi:hypothetical protein
MPSFFAPYLAYVGKQLACSADKQESILAFVARFVDYFSRFIVYLARFIVY